MAPQEHPTVDPIDPDVGSIDLSLRSRIRRLRRRAYTSTTLLPRSYPMDINAEEATTRVPADRSRVLVTFCAVIVAAVASSGCLPNTHSAFGPGPASVRRNGAWGAESAMTSVHQYASPVFGAGARSTHGPSTLDTEPAGPPKVVGGSSRCGWGIGLEVDLGSLFRRTERDVFGVLPVGDEEVGVGVEVRTRRMDAGSIFIGEWGADVGPRGPWSRTATLLRSGNACAGVQLVVRVGRRRIDTIQHR